MTITFSIIRHAWALLSRSITSHRFPEVFFITMWRLGIVDPDVRFKSSKVNVIARSCQKEKEERKEGNKKQMQFITFMSPNSRSYQYTIPLLKKFWDDFLQFFLLRNFALPLSVSVKVSLQTFRHFHLLAVWVCSLNFSQASLLGQKHRFMFCVKKQKTKKPTLPF